MGYVFVGAICFVVGAISGVFTLALVSINRNTESVQFKGNYSVPEEAKDADR